MEVMPRTIYSDIVGMPDPMLLGVTIHYYNHSDQALYMKIFGSGPSPWSSNSVAMGTLASGSNAYLNLDNFLSRTKPTSETIEQVTLILRGYSDSGYSNLVAEFSRNVTIIMIKSDDGSWTQDILDNFDDGQYHNWDIEKVIIGGYSLDTVTKSIATDYVLSTPYSLKGSGYSNWNGNPQTTFAQQLIIYKDAAKLIHLGAGAPYTGGGTDIPINKWMRLVVPLPVNTTFTIKVYVAGNWLNSNYSRVFAFQLFKSIITPNRTNVYAIINVRIYSGGTSNGYIHIWLDDFKIISK